MASSSSPSNQRRRPLKKRQPLTRSNSSLLGTIRNIVTAPLTWFASTDDFEDSKDLKGKRRRVVVPQNGPLGEHDDWSTPNKRMRVHSPPRDHQQLHHPPSGGSYGYLDPPTSVFQQQHNQPNFFSQQINPHSVSVSIPVPTMQAYETLRNSNTFIRGSTLSRTMSIDPPSRPVSRSSAMASIPAPLGFDASMETSATLVRRPTRDLSMPPLSARPSFRMRSSMTPQPQPQKEASEPPSLSTLVINPMFVRGPSAHVAECHPPSATLGSLVDSVRSTHSPVRQHSSLLFGTSVENANNVCQESPAEKALHELDVYKTPLVPTRLRSSISASSSQIADSTSTDLFKSRRKSSLVLMEDGERVSRLVRKSNIKGNAPLVNKTKPYAGEGGMKKLLARRRMEAEKYALKKDKGDDEKEKAQARGVEGDPRSGLSRRLDEIHTSPGSTGPSSCPLPASQDWYSTASVTSRSASVSSLRVGRTRTRAHIVRPIARPMKTKFSAAYEDDDSMDDGDALQDESEKQLEREMLDEAAKRAPVFKIPEGFSFAKVMNPMEHDSTNAKEPPISSLPFSFTMTSAEPSMYQNDDSQQTEVSRSSFPPAATPLLVPSVNSSLPLTASPSAAQVVSAPSPSPVVEDRRSNLPLVKDSSLLPTFAPQAGATNDGINDSSVPNFFASSLAFTKPLEVPQPPVLTFPSSVVPATPNTTSSANLSHNPTPCAPVKDTENPLWEGDNDKRDCVKSLTAQSGFGGITNSTPGATNMLAIGTSPPPTPATTPSAHGPSVSVSEPAEDFAKKPDDVVETVGPSLDTPSTAFAFPRPQTAQSTLFGGDVPKAISPFGDTTGSVLPTSGLSSAQASKPVAPLFTFGEPAPSVLKESSKPLFGGTIENSTALKPLFSADAFSFGDASSASDKAQSPAATPFSFGAAPSTPPAADTKKTLPFGFKDSSAPAPAPVPFSFGSDTGNVSGPMTKSFSSFGMPVSIAPTDRPTTPPKHDDQEVRMEESPTREVQQSTTHGKPVETRPSLGGSAFSFTVGVPGPEFGSQPNAVPTSSFVFGTSTSPNPFAKDSKASDSKPFAGFGQMTASSVPFTFGQKPVENNDPPRPLTTGSFSFTSAPSSATGPGPTFPFGGPSNSSTGSLFGQTHPSGSAPSSPSTFNQQSPFSFTAPPPMTTNSFAFGSSQPASPAGGNASLSLPQPATPGGFNGGAGGFGQQPSSQFSAPAPAPAPSGATLFTIGAAPSASQGARQIRKLPTRRGGAKR